ncbi:hypothetical protein OESDEN_04281 [Oesophagostomum dentatum]|uniref:Uncharacterized protein n=1 Tax=Oesophagostomum dentatum TaxID=61180 RepID=A0A0B1TES9_OESDE|nr:hypothetical protein OESDEN_04281 [Oesophagostomum dentatum]
MSVDCDETPITRSRTYSSDSPISTSSESASVTQRITQSLAHVNDDDVVHGQDARELRDATVQAISDVWSDSRSTATSLIRQVNQNGVARDKVEELPGDQKESFDAVVAHLRRFFEGPQQRYMARQALSTS